MNPLRWRSEHQLALVVFAALGGIGGLLAAWFVSPLYKLSSASLSGEWSNMTAVFKLWITAPGLYWPWPAIGATITGLAFYAVNLARLPALGRSS